MRNFAACKESGLIVPSLSYILLTCQTKIQSNAPSEENIGTDRMVENVLERLLKHLQIVENVTLYLELTFQTFGMTLKQRNQLKSSVYRATFLFE